MYLEKTVVLGLVGLVEQLMVLPSFLISSNEHKACMMRDGRMSQNIPLSLGTPSSLTKQKALIRKTTLMQTKHRGVKII